MIDEKYYNIYDLITRYFSGETTFEEVHQIESWVKEDTANKKIYNELRDIWISSGNNSDIFNSKKAFRRFIRKTNQYNQSRKKVLNVYKFFKYAAVLVLFIALPLAGYYYSEDYYSRNSMVSIKCKLGDRSNVVLPDGTSVWLNSGSEISYAGNFNHKNRNIKLSGEAYFRVKRDIFMPFNIKTEKLNVKVLGTSFDVKAFQDEDNVEVTVDNGKVNVSNGLLDFDLVKNHRVIYDKKRGVFRQKKVNDTKIFNSWKDGKLMFKNESLSTLSRKIERWYNVNIHYEDADILEYRFTGTLDRENILDVLDLFKRSKDINSKIVRNNIYLWLDKRRK